MRSRAIMHWKLTAAGDKTSLPKHEALSHILGEGEGIRRAFVELLDEKRLLALVEATPRPRVTFKYQAEGQEIAFEKASEGQRAAALLMMLLKQKGGPLIIDQPESDLDNNIITKLTDLIHEIKSNRQLIFATHNANLVVNGASELVVHVVNKDDGSRVIGTAGAIDDPPVRETITLIMEGGEKAFKDRQRKYGF